MPNNDSRSLARCTKTAVVHKVIDITPGIDVLPAKPSENQALA